MELLKSKKGKQLSKSVRAGAEFSTMLFLYILLSLILGGILIACVKEDSITYKACASTFSIIAMFITILLYKKSSGKTLINFCNIKKTNPIFYLLAVGISIGMLLGFGFINTLFAQVLEGAGVKTETSFPLDNIWQHLLFTFLLGILPALFEECFFRGMLLTESKGIKPLFAVIIISIFFSLYHCSLKQIFYQLIYGAVLTILVITSKSVIPSIITHFFNNFIIISLAFFKLDYKVDLLAVRNIVVGILVVAICLVMAFRYRENTQEVSDKENPLCMIFPYGLFGVLITICLMVASVVNL